MGGVSVTGEDIKTLPVTPLYCMVQIRKNVRPINA